jgi:hypothetical protein
MTEKMLSVLMKKYDAQKEDAILKIEMIIKGVVIPEHIDITGEVDKLLHIIAESEEKAEVLWKLYGKTKAN